MSEWFDDFISKLIAWARAEGCVCLTAAGRKGWTRLVKQYGGYRVADENGWAAWRLDL